jgi:GT2 family glycosyltransferase
MSFDGSERLAGEREAHGADATIVIPQHDRSELTLAVVRPLRRWEPRCWPILVVDDGSSAEAAAELEQLPADVQLLRQPHRGVTAAWNLGLEHVTTPIVVLLNNDVLIDGAWVEQLIGPVRCGTAAVSGVELRRERAVPASVLQRVGRSDFVAGWCWAFRMEDARSIGGFDPTLWLYFSDTDLQVRLLANARSSANIALVGDSPVRHIGHRSTRLLPGRGAKWHSDRARFIAKWRGEHR